MTPNRALASVLSGAVLAAGIFLQACTADSSPAGDGTPAGDIETISGAKDPGTYETTGAQTPATGSAGNASTTTSANGGDPTAACIAACETKHPKGALIGKGIDSCWSKSCPTECNGIGAGAPKAAAHGSCENPVSTPSADCSQCTVDKCCSAWDACFDDADCTALNECSIACYK